MTPVALALLVSVRNLGDAAVHSGWLAQLIDRGFAARYVVLTQPGSAFLFEGLPDCTVVSVSLPIGTAKRFSSRDVWPFIRAIGRLRRLQPTVSIDLVGDFRERWLARLAGTRRHLHIGWAPDHAFAPIIRNPFGPGRPMWTVPASVPNVYAACAGFLERVSESSGDDSLPDTKAQAPLLRKGRVFSVGLHPLASQRCKIWPVERWRALGTALLNQGARVTAFCAPDERPLLDAIFEPLGDRVARVSGSLGDFGHAVGELDLMIGLDSFAVHLAERHGTPSVTINGANPPELWTPPHGVTVSNSGGCPYHPCYNVPQCIGTQREYACIASISVETVAHAAFCRLDSSPPINAPH